MDIEQAGPSGFKSKHNAKPTSTRQRPCSSSALPFFLFLCLLPCLGAGLACDNTDSCRPSDPLGKIEGYIYAGGDPVSTVINIFEAENEPFDYTGQTTSDSTGWYSFELPTGKYDCQLDTYYERLQFNQHRLDFWHQGEPFDVTGGLHRRDINGGALNVQVIMPGNLQSSHTSLDIHFLNESTGDYDNVFTINDAHNDSLITFSTGLIPTGDVKLSLDMSVGSGDQNESIWIKDEDSQNSARIITVSPGNPTQLIYEMPTPGFISGTINGSWESVEWTRPELEVWSVDSIRVATSRADDTGFFRFPIFYRDSVRIKSIIRTMEQWYGGYHFEDAATIQVSPGAELTLEPIIESGINIHFENHFSESMWSIQYRLLYPDGTLVAPRSYTSIHSDVLFIPNLRPGDYYLNIIRNTNRLVWCDQYFDRAMTLSKARRIEVPPDGQVVDLSMTLMEGGSISGKYMTSAGNPFRRRPVVAIPQKADYGYDYEDMLNSEDGTFSILGLPDGRYIVGILYNYYDLYYYPGTQNITEATVIEITDQSSINNLTWSHP
jgi:hypothetical protein